MSVCPVEIPSRRSALVAVVDPDATVRRRIVALLHALGADVADCATAAEFLAGPATRLPVCLLAENRLPDMSGFELLKELRARGLSIPTILMSDDADVTVAVNAIRCGAIDFIEKPHIDRALVTRVAPILDVDDRHTH